MSESNRLTGIENQLRDDPNFRREYVRRHEASASPTTSGGDKSPDATPSESKVRQILVEFWETVTWDIGPEDRDLEPAEQAILQLIRDEVFAAETRLKRKLQDNEWATGEVQKLESKGEQDNE